MEDRRRSIRIPIATVAHITPHGLQTAAEVVVRDLSVKGMGCSADTCFQKGDMLLIKLNLNTTQGETMTESLVGRIAWISESHPQNGDPVDQAYRYAFGIEFRQAKESNPQFYDYLQSLEEPTHPPKER
ncbi:MAG: PilZ domain-containing protein [Nitrospiria bacterium]